MSVVHRAKAIIVSPRATWPLIEQERATIQTIYTYVAIMAAIPAVASFIGLCLVGVGGFGISYRVPFVSGLLSMGVGYALSLAMVFAMALLVDALAPAFGGQRNRVNALKVVGYGTTAAFVAGVLSIVPLLAVLTIVAAIYSIYLIYTGLPVLMKCPPGKAALYTGTVVLAGFLCAVALSLVSSALVPHGSFEPDATDGAKGLTIGGAPADKMLQKMEAVGKQMESAQQSGDIAGMTRAAAGALSAATGGQQRTPLPAAQLKAMMPDSAVGLARTAIEERSDNTAGMPSSSVNATYAKGSKQFEVTLTDTGGLASTGGVAAFMNSSSDTSTESEVARTYRQGTRGIQEQYLKDGSHSEYTIIMANGMVIEARGEMLNIEQVKAAVAAIDLPKLESVHAVDK